MWKIYVLHSDTHLVKYAKTRTSFDEYFLNYDSAWYRYDSLDVRKNRYQKNPSFWCILHSDSLGRNDSLLLD